MKVGNLVRIDKCEVCPVVVGKVLPIDDIIYDLESITEPKAVELNFGRGRPQKNRPKQFVIGDISLVVEESPPTNVSDCDLVDNKDIKSRSVS